MGINFNAAAAGAQQQIRSNTAAANNAIGRVSSGKAQNTPSDDAAGKSIANKLAADISSMTQAKKNASQAASLINVAAGGMDKITDALVRMKALAAQVQNGALDTNARAYADKEYQKLLTEIDATANKTRFNGTALLNTAAVTLNAAATAANFSAASTNGSATAEVYTITFANATNTFTATGGTSGNVLNKAVSASTVPQTINFENGLSLTVTGSFDYGTDIASGAAVTATIAAGGAGTFTFQIGENAASDTLGVSIASLTSSSLGINSTDVTTAANAATASGLIDSALNTVNQSAADIGAQQKRLEFTESRLSVAVENLQSAKASFDEADIAAEMTEYTLANVRAQAGIAMLAKANQMPADLLTLVR